MNHWQSQQGSFDVQELMDSDSDASGSSGRGDSEGFQDELMDERELEGDYGMGQVSGSERDDMVAEGISNYSEYFKLDSDNEIKLGGLSDSEDSEFDDWKAFDEEELEAEHSDEEALREFEEMMGDEEYAELWSTRRYSLYHVLPLFTNIFSYREGDLNGRRS